MLGLRRFAFWLWMTVAVLGIGRQSLGQTKPSVAKPLESAPAAISLDDRHSIDTALTHLSQSLDAIRQKAFDAGDMQARDLLADADLFQKGVTWALRYDNAFTDRDVQLMRSALDHGTRRAELLSSGRVPWTTRTGKVLRGYISSVDGSTQPYGLVIPRGYSPLKPIRLDVILHGSSKPVGMSELRFGARFDEGDEAVASSPDADFIELHPLGRVENCYRWAGETDVFEAIDAVCRHYNIDRDRIVLRGMSMGASGTWHLGLKHPDRFVAIGPYCGYVDTHRFSHTPGFTQVNEIPEYQELGLHMIDSIDYAANASMTPEIAAIGDHDPFYNYAHVIMEEAMAKEGLKIVNLISKGTKHQIDPVTHAEQMRRIGEFSALGLNHRPKSLRFVTWTLKYNRCFWLELIAIQKHYSRAEVQASVAGDNTVDIKLIQNVSMFSIAPSVFGGGFPKVRIEGRDLAIPEQREPNVDHPLIFRFEGAQWRCLGAKDRVDISGKRPGVQGPIDDAFTAPFICVRGTGKPWNAAIGAWAEASLRRFQYEYARYMRGDVPVKNDVDVTTEDLKTKNIVLFGDPGSNSWINRALPKLPLSWDRDKLRFNGEQYSARQHAPALIVANPLPGSGGHYLVLNSGHTFHEKEFADKNYLLFPRQGDWSIVRVGEGTDKWEPAAPEFPETVLNAGLFNEQWQLPPRAP